MALRLTAERRISFDCTSNDETFSVTMRLLPDAQVEKFSDDEAGNTEFLRMAIVDLSGVVGDDDNPLEFSSELVETMLAYVDLRVAMLRGYRKAIVSAQAGN